MKSMSKQCDIVRDILPLYVDGACSEASAEMVKEHLNACADCNAIYQKLLSHTNEDCLLYTSDAADDMQCVDLGGRRIIKKKFFQAEDGIRD